MLNFLKEDPSLIDFILSYGVFMCVSVHVRLIMIAQPIMIFFFHNTNKKTFREGYKNSKLKFRKKNVLYA